MSKKVIIVGGVAGGASAAARLRRLDEDAQIILLEKGEYISYANCGLPYYIGGVITQKEELTLQTPENMKRRFNLDVRVNSEVVKLNPENKTLEIHDLIDKQTYTESYDQLILSPGATPFMPVMPGIESSKIFTLRDIPDTYKIKEFVEENKPKSAILIGAGFIGLEVAENLHMNGIDITVIERSNHVIGPLCYEMASIAHKHLKEKNVELLLNQSASSFIETEDGLLVELGDGEKIKTDMVIVGIGVRPETQLASQAGLKLGETGGILVDEYLRTSDPNIYAVGDAVEKIDFINGQPALVALAGPANKQGRIAANNICGYQEKYTGVLGTSIVKIFDITVAITGNNERTLKRNNIEYEKSIIHSPSHASYYPGADYMAIKLMFGKKDGKILGAQIVGKEGVDKRIDVFSTAIAAGMTVRDLQSIELAYAPPYSSAKDPVNMAGYTATNILDGLCDVIHWNEIEDIDLNTSVLVDVQTRAEFKNSTIKGAINIPVDELRDRLRDLPKDKEIILFCYIGLRGYIANRILRQNGFENVKNLSGGLQTYSLAVQKW